MNKITLTKQKSLLPFEMFEGTYLSDKGIYLIKLIKNVSTLEKIFDIKKIELSFNGTSVDEVLLTEHGLSEEEVYQLQFNCFNKTEFTYDVCRFKLEPLKELK